MTHQPQELISRALEDDLSASEFREFEDWLRKDDQHLEQFARAAMLHDRLRSELLAMDAVNSAKLPVVSAPSKAQVLRRTAAWGIAAVAAMLMAIVWFGLGETTVSAATELNRLIATQQSGTDRTYQIDVEEIAATPTKHDADPGRPPKPPLDRATLHVRHGNQFVLIRETPEGHPFITGSNGRTSWAISPDGPVRFSSDLTRFNRDLPGHEQDMPLINVEEGLSKLTTAYDVELLPVESPDANAMASRLLVGVKKRGFRGPRRVEITYLVESGEISQLRLVEMPYGPERLTIRMTLVEERDLGERFFDHNSHYPTDRPVIEE